MSESQPDKTPNPRRRTSLGERLERQSNRALAPALGVLDVVGAHVIFAARAFSWLPRRPYRVGNYLDAMVFIGFGSLPIVLLVGGFTGMVTELQSVAAVRSVAAGMEGITGGTTGKAIATELGPVLTSLMLAGRVGAGIASELGNMRISEQIDALESMAINPIQYLVLPRLVAAILIGPILVLLFFILAMAGAYFVGVVTEGVDPGHFRAGFERIVEIQDIVQGLIKASLFGFAVALIGCYQGYNASGGGRGVGIATSRAVVVGSVSVLVLDYFATEVLLVVL